MISDFFIQRPVLANVLAILMIVIGAVALFALPVAISGCRASDRAGHYTLTRR
jgi:hypothetical protein